MSEFLKDINHLGTEEYLNILVKYLSVLQDGRTKPDTNGGGYIRESVYNIEEIEEVKSRINNILGIKKVPKTIEFKDMSTKRTYKY